jgi:adenylate cyclase class IV
LRNLELKCRYPSLKKAESIALRELSARFACRITQTDTYFFVSAGRLKLRHNVCHSGPESYELIFYHRPDETSARVSDYQIVPLADGKKVQGLLQAALGVKKRVRKLRNVFLADNLRMHLDKVRGLGEFLEFELIVTPGHSLPSCRKQMSRLMELFAIEPATVIGTSYSDMP